MDHSSRSMPPLETLHAFEVAARAGSFSAAAERLNLTHGAVSRQIAKLEAWLGLKVFDRGARGVALTLEGQRLFRHFLGALGRSAAVSMVSAGVPLILSKTSR